MTAPAPARPPIEAPVHPGAPVVGSALDLRRDYLGTVLRAGRSGGDVVRVHAGPPGWRHVLYVVSSPAGVQRVLVDEPHRYRKDTPAYVEVRTALGNGLLTSQDAEWRRQRHLLAPVFTRRRLTTAYATVMVEEAQQVARRWEAAAASGSAVDGHAEMTRYAARVVGRVLFGADVDAAMARLGPVAADVNLGMLRRGMSPHPPPRWVPTPTNRRLAAGLREARGAVNDILTARTGSRTAAQGRDEDMLGLLLHARDPDTGDGLSPAEVADQVLVFLLAGHETTATTLACALVELARHPEWQEALAAEVDGVLDGRPVTAPDVPALERTGWVVREALRLYPAAHTIARTCAGGDVLCGHRIPAGAIVVLPTWAVHRSPALWPDPDRFAPDRFAAGSGQPRGDVRHAYFPFGAGPHTCIGQQLALLEAPVALATLLARFRLATAVAGMPLEAGIALRPSRPLPLQVTAR